MKKPMNFLTLLAVVLFTGLFINSAAMAEGKKPASAQELVELYPTDFKPAFTRNTVIKLNAIVHRSYDVINTYDAIIADVKQTMAQSENASRMSPEAKAQLQRIAGLAKESKKILMDMNAAVDELTASKEDYNAAILAGMVDFVQDVEREISKQEKQLMKMRDPA
jgi:hypothetical protein